MSEPKIVKNKNAIVFACDDRYVVGLTVALKSLFYYEKHSKEIPIYILDHGITLERKKCMMDSFSNEELRRLEFIDVVSSALPGCIETMHLSRAAYLRIVIPQLLPSSVERVLYLDSDVLILADLVELFQIPFEQKVLLAAQDWCGSFFNPVIDLQNPERFGVKKEDRYFNSGVLVFNLIEWRSQGLSDLLFQFIERNPDCLQLADQTVINLGLLNRIGALEQKWNQQTIHESILNGTWQIPYVSMNLDDAKILHFCTDNKPWYPDCILGVSARFEEFRDRTKWKRRKESLAGNGFFLIVLKPRSVASFTVQFVTFVNCNRVFCNCDFLVFSEGVDPFELSIFLHAFEYYAPLDWRIVWKKGVNASEDTTHFLLKLEFQLGIQQQAKPWLNFGNAAGYTSSAREIVNLSRKKVYHFKINWSENDRLLSLLTILNLLWVQSPIFCVHLVFFMGSEMDAGRRRVLEKAILKIRECSVRWSPMDQPISEINPGDWNFVDYVENPSQTKRISLVDYKALLQQDSLGFLVEKAEEILSEMGYDTHQ